MSEMIKDPEAYFEKLIPPRDELLVRLEKEALAEDIPIIGPFVGQLLSILVGATQASDILELGTATGYSAIWMARGMTAESGCLTTIEMNDDMIKRANDNLKAAGVDSLVNIIEADALKAVGELSDPFDMIFLDIEKEFYIDVLDDCERLLRSGGLLAADNVGFLDADSFNREIHDRSTWRVVNLFSFLPHHSPEHDGVCLALRV